MCKTPEYSAWKDMKKRCLNPRCKSFKNYGGRGIRIYDGWLKSFSAFFEYMGPKPTHKHTSERIDNNLGYFPGNVKWATRTDQSNNQRRTHKITFNGKSMSLKQWSKELGIPRTTLNSRIVLMGWPIEKALTEPVQSHIPRSSPSPTP